MADPQSRDSQGLFASEDGFFRLHVLLPLAVSGGFDFSASLDVPAGSWVKVNFRGRSLVGMVWDAPKDAKVIPREKLKPVEDILDLPAVPEAFRRFIGWVAEYTMTAPGLVLRMAMRAPGIFEPPRTRTAYRKISDIDVTAQIRLTPERKRVLEIVEDGLCRPPPELAELAGCSPAVIKGLAGVGLLEPVAISASAEVPQLDANASGPPLSDAQRAAADHLCQAFAAHAFSATLLDGVTGSGKTEVYFEAVSAALKAEKQVLILLPEIALSEAFIGRFVQRFGARPLLWHSDVSPAARRNAWQAVATGKAQLVVGARSALFLPFADLGLIIVDEEHESAFKQEEGVLYHARDMAVARARLGGFPIVLASATPSLETLVNVEEGRYGRVELPHRHGAAKLPDISLVDMRQERPPSGQWIAPPVRQAIETTLEAGEQALIFLNRRGYAPLTLCRTCGHRVECPNCTAWLVEHRQYGILQCHHCGYTTARMDLCPSCGDSDSLAACGPGVERIEEELKDLFPKQETLLLASDTMTHPAELRAAIARIQEQDVQLIIGTQIIAKGHHFPGLTLVAVIDADLGLSGGDLRASERTYQLLNQVAGRAGRGESPGQVLMQTYMPQNPVITAIAQGDREGFFAAESEQRQLVGMPPFGRLVGLIVSSENEALADETARALGHAAPHFDGVRVLGPAPAPLSILRNRHRRRLLLKAGRKVHVQRIIRDWLARITIPGGVKVQIDIDPYSFL